MAQISITKQLDLVYNSESTIIINSALRDVGRYPAPNYFQIQLPRVIGAAKEIVLTHFVPVAAVPGTVIEIFVDELLSDRAQSAGAVVMGGPAWLVPTGFLPYVSQGKINDVSVFPKMQAPNVHDLTISCRDSVGALIVGMPDYVMRLYVRSWW